MGILVSKTDTSFGMDKVHSNDDEATARTEDSSIRPRYPRSRRNGPQQRDISTTQYHTIHHDPQELREVQWSQYHAPTRRSQSSGSMVDGTSDRGGPSLIRRDSDPGATTPTTKSSAPVKFPPRRRNLSGWDIYGSREEPSEADNSDYLVRMYNARTWEMYFRITEARKNKSRFWSDNEEARKNRVQEDCTTTPSTSSTIIPNHTYLTRNGERTTSEWENLQHESLDSESGHVMVFLFDFD